MAKRSLDLAVALVGLAVLSPLILVIALAIRLTIGTPVYFRQVRPGRESRPFTLLKFRTMNSSTDVRGELLPDAQRLTRFGTILRRSSLDELPQLWNVLVGDMSLVGPRPLMMQYLGRYTPEQARRHEVPPGITGWAQINGRNSVTWEERFRLDVWYVDNRSFLLDLRILALTTWRVLKREGISPRGHSFMPEFMGTQQSGLNSDSRQSDTGA
jgi:lipopolysaccharide/colanic/teichoic acid biosynthesis glycosyltransferase